MTTNRHQWDKGFRFPHKTERECLKCGIVKVTRREVDGTRPVWWTEFYRGLDQIPGEATPPCECAEVFA